MSLDTEKTPSTLDLSTLPDLSKIEWVVFDLDMTLWDHNSAIAHALGIICQELNHDIEPFLIHYHEQSHALWIQFSRGEIDMASLRLLRLGNVFRIMGDERTPEEVEQICERYLDLYLAYQGEMAGAFEIMCLAANHAKLGILTNATRITQNAKIRQLRGKDLLSLVLTVDETNCAKSSPDFYKIAEKEMGNPAPENILYIGDSWHDDAAPSYRRNWNVAWIDLNRKGKPDGFESMTVIRSVLDLETYFSKSLSPKKSRTESSTL